MKERAYPVYTVNKHAEGLLVGGHPWVYENDILHSPENEPENGTLADVVSTKGSYLGTGFVSLKSKIRVRLISRNANDTFDAAFWRRRVEYAWNYRKTVLEPADLSACRVIFGEADQFPGLTVDRFSNILVTQTLSVGMEKLKPVLFPLLAEVLRADGLALAALHAAFRLFFVLQILFPCIFYMVVGSVNVVFVPQCEVLRNIYASRSRHTIPTAGTAILYSALQI